MAWPAETRDKVLALIASGLSLRQIAAIDNMPDRATIVRWAVDDPEFATRYARAQEAKMEAVIDDLADVEARVESGELKPEAAKVILWSRQWRAEKLRPKVYGRQPSPESEALRDLAALSLADLRQRVAQLAPPADVVDVEARPLP